MNYENHDLDTPRWRNNTAYSIMMISLMQVFEALDGILNEWTHLKSVPEENEEEVNLHLEQFGALFLHEAKLEMASDTYILMGNIDLESKVNMFCFYNLGETVADSVERLALDDRLEVAHCVLSLNQFKGSSEHMYLKKLIKWRNAYVHGKHPRRSYRSLRENYLVTGVTYRTVEEVIVELLDLSKAYEAVRLHLEKINVSDRSKGLLRDTRSPGALADELKLYVFKDGYPIEKKEGH